MTLQQVLERLSAIEDVLDDKDPDGDNAVHGAQLVRELRLDIEIERRRAGQL